ncbi:DMT family transporter [Thiomonas sp. FB-6]|uniref:DMT family transporter n=1 Tax=Thiomonas sp. FB-6 TaxID=1158291 RepID=UPI00036EC331|nr:DMT family transporter [Thiomonas sp. FB-6]
MAGIREWARPGVLSALGAALLFGAGTPLAKRLLQGTDPWVLAGLLYLGAGLGLGGWRLLRRAPRVRLARAEGLWFAAAVGFGGVLGPVLLMLGLRGMPASGAALLLNAESVFTALLAWFVFRENFDRRIALGMLAIVAGAVLLGGTAAGAAAHWSPRQLAPAALVLGACLAWGIDNNLTRKVSLADATWVASVKGLAAGSVNLALALGTGAALPGLRLAAAAMVVGLVAYGVSLSLFVVALRHLGSARTGAYFSVAPFFGALLALLMGDALSLPLAGAAVLMGVGVWLHLSERHEHAHTHEPLEHEHEHVHDEHHQHEHEQPVAPGVRHTHRHRHAELTHRHAHVPDTHHRHEH